MRDKRFKVVTFSRQKYKDNIEMTAAFEDYLNNLPNGYDLHSWTFNPATSESYAAYRVVIERVPETAKEPASGRKFRYKGE